MRTNATIDRLREMPHAFWDEKLHKRVLEAPSYRVRVENSNAGRSSLDVRAESGPEAKAIAAEHMRRTHPEGEWRAISARRGPNAVGAANAGPELLHLKTEELRERLMAEEREGES